METTEAIKIVRALAAGCDPETGNEVLAAETCRRPAVVKALNRALSALVREDKRERSQPQNAGRYWSREEIAKVCSEVQEGMDIHEIAKLHNRTVPAIVARLIRLGKIKPPTGRAA